MAVKAVKESKYRHVLKGQGKFYSDYCLRRDCTVYSINSALTQIEVTEICKGKTDREQKGAGGSEKRREPKK